MITRDQAIAMAKEADTRFTGKEEDILGTCVVGFASVERFANIAYRQALEDAKKAAARGVESKFPDMKAMAMAIEHAISTLGE